MTNSHIIVYRNHHRAFVTTPDSEKDFLAWAKRTEDDPLVATVRITDFERWEYHDVAVRIESRRMDSEHTAGCTSKSH